MTSIDDMEDGGVVWMKESDGNKVEVACHGM